MKNLKDPYREDEILIMRMLRRIVYMWWVDVVALLFLFLLIAFFDWNIAKGLILPLVALVAVSLINVFWFKRSGETRLRAYEDGNEQKIEGLKRNDTKGWVVFLIAAVVFIMYQLIQIF